MAACTQDANSQVDSEVQATDTCSNDNLMDGLFKVLTQWASQPTSREGVTYFHCTRAPAMSIRDYVVRLRSYFFCSDTCFVVALIYVDRIVKKHPRIQVCNLSCHRLFVTALILAVKFNEDTYYTNAYYGKVGGVAVKEVNKLERCFIQLLDWNLDVKPEEYTVYCDLLIRAINGRRQI